MDCTFMTELGKFNYRVGVIIYSGRKVLMARNPNEERAFYYSVGGRVRFGESMEEAVLRELREETGINCEIDRLAAIHENFFTDDDGIPFHEVSFSLCLSPMQEQISVCSCFFSLCAISFAFHHQADFPCCVGNISVGIYSTFTPCRVSAV